MSDGRSNVGAIRREPDVPMLDGQDLDWLIEKFLLVKRRNVQGETTVTGYAYKLKWFRDWWQREGPTREWLLKEEDLVEFEQYLRSVESSWTGGELSYHTRNDVLRRLREALRWAWTKQHTTFDYGKWVPKAVGGPPLRRAARVGQLLRLMDAASQSPFPERDQAILAILIGMGLRRGEVTNLNIEELIIEADFSGYATVHGKRTKANQTGIRQAAMDSATGRFVVTYLDSMGYESGPLFRHSLSGERLSDQGIFRATKRAIQLAGLEKEIQGCHDLRRAFSTYYARSKPGANSADLLRRQMGHSSYSMTSHYNLLDVEDIRQNMVSPLAEIASDDPY